MHPECSGETVREARSFVAEQVHLHESLSSGSISRNGALCTEPSHQKALGAPAGRDAGRLSNAASHFSTFGRISDERCASAEENVMQEPKLLNKGPAQVTTRAKMCQGSKWQRYFFSRKESVKTTWKFRLVLLLLGMLLVSVTRQFWILRIGQSLVCAEEMRPSDILLVEDFAVVGYRVFERAAALHQAGLAARVLIPTEASGEPERANAVSQGIAELKARMARLPHPEILPIWMREPISLNAAYQIRDFLSKEHLKSVLVVTEGFRSQRSALVYHAVLDPAGIKVGCMPVFGQTTPKNWTKTWHGIEEVTKQFIKLQYYRFYVLWTRSI
jgi:hypothetical protein